jgi:lipopolysaccharide export system permease protein
MLIAFAFLGAPRTTRQSQMWPISGVISAVSLLRLIGFACTVMSIKHPVAAVFQYLAVAGACAASLVVIGRGTIIEPPAFVIKAADTVTGWLATRAGLFARPAS